MRIMVALLVVCTAAPAVAQTRNADTAETTSRFLSPNETMKDVRTVIVRVSEIKNLEQQITKTTLRDAIELRLRQAGVTVMDSSVEENLLFPEVRLRVNALVDSDGLVAYNLSLEFIRIITVPNVADDQLYAEAVLWAKNKIVTVGRSGFSRSLEEEVDGYATAFVNAYLEQNPKR